MDILNQFGINPILLAAQVVNFLILLFILKKFLYGPILKVLDERKKTITQSLENAQEIEQKLAQTQEDIDKMIVKASSEAQKIIDESKKEGNIYLEEAKQRSEKLADDIVKKGEEALRVEKEKMQMEIKQEMADIVVAVLQKVTGKIISKKDQKDLVEKAVKQLS